MTLRSAVLSNSISNPDFQVGPPEMSFDVNEYLNPSTPVASNGLNKRGLPIKTRIDPISAAIALGSPPDPRTNPQGYIDWYNSAQVASRNIMGLIENDEQQAALQPFFKNLAIGEGLMNAVGSYGNLQGAETSGVGALTNFINNWDTLPEQAYRGQPSRDWFFTKALNGDPGYSFAEGWQSGIGGGLFPGQQYLVTDLNGKTLYSGTDESKVSDEALHDYMKKGYSLQISNPETGKFDELYRYVPDPDPLGQFAMMAAPMLGSALLPFLAPGFMGLGQAGTAAAGAALGSTGAGIATGQGVGDILKNAALSAGLAYAGNSLAAGGSGSGISAGLSEGASLAPGALASLPANLAAISAGAQGALAGAGLGAAGLGAAGTAGGILSAAGAGASELAPIVVTGTTGGGIGAGTALGGAALAGGAAAAAGAGGGAPAPNPAEDIVVTAGDKGYLLPSVSTAIGSTIFPELTQPVGTTTPTTPNKGLLSKPISSWTVGDWLNAASLGSGILGGIIGGQGTGSGTGSGGNSYMPNLGNLSQYAGKDMRASPAITNYETYGFGPEATFFKPEYNQIVPGVLSSATQPAATYKPLING